MANEWLNPDYAIAKRNKATKLKNEIQSCFGCVAAILATAGIVASVIYIIVTIVRVAWKG